VSAAAAGAGATAAAAVSAVAARAAVAAPEQLVLLSMRLHQQQQLQQRLQQQRAGPLADVLAPPAAPPVAAGASALTSGQLRQAARDKPPTARPHSQLQQWMDEAPLIGSPPTSSCPHRMQHHSCTQQEGAKSSHTEQQQATQQPEQAAAGQACFAAAVTAAAATPAGAVQHTPGDDTAGLEAGLGCLLLLLPPALSQPPPAAAAAPRAMPQSSTERVSQAVPGVSGPHPPCTTEDLDLLWSGAGAQRHRSCVREIHGVFSVATCSKELLSSRGALLLPSAVEVV